MPKTAKTKLALYRSKRDFEKTAEPSGATEIARAAHPRFVIQKHAATRLHYDLRLELDGVFKSWAVTRGPSLDPADKRLAVEVEDHPLDYGDFEGTIPKGEYGGGTVMLWDRGFWEHDGPGSAEEALRKGDLKFTLAGEKLRGSWVLVRMKHDRDRGKRTNWLLIKHRDGLERKGEGDAALEQDRSVASGRTMEQIAAGKGRGPKPFITGKGKAADPGAIWHSNRTKNEAPPARTERDNKVPATGPSVRRKRTAMPSFIAPQLCRSVARPPSGNDWVHEIKFDGYRMQLRTEAGEALLRTRKGLDWSDKLPATIEAAAHLPDSIIDGEMVALDASGAPDFASLQAALSEGRSRDLVYFAFDLLYAEGEDLRALPLSERKARLKSLLGADSQTGSIRYVEHMADAGDAVLESACHMNLEGIVSKCLTAPYRSARTGTWTKAKCRDGHEVVIGGWSGSGRNLRSLLVGVYRGSTLVYVGRVGTGFNAKNAPELLERLKALQAEVCPFDTKTIPRRQADWYWAKPRLVAEIEFAGWTGGGMVRQAAFKGLREDKPAREVVAEHPSPPESTRLNQPTAQKRSARGTQQAQSGHVVLGLVISNPDKPLWPAAERLPAITKLDLARYLESIGPWMIEHLRGRPCSVIRAPDGLDGERFFQRHEMPGLSSLVSLTSVSGDRKPYVQIDRREALIAMAQIASVEYHPWNCAPFSPEIPGRLVFDLDPGPDVPFTATIAAARELKERLEALGLITFCKTTGGKGLHVVTPLAAADRTGLGWPEAKSFAQAVCSAMAKDSPDRYLLNMSKKLRNGRIFLDYLRNDRMSTAVAPLSPRLRPGAPVSMPLNWPQVKSGLDPARYTLRTAPALLAKSKPWADYCDAERPLEDAIQKLVANRTVKA